MWFKIRRTSEWNDGKPCEEAVKRSWPKYRYRTCTEAEYNRRFAESEGGLWRDIGTDHTSPQKGHIQRREGNESLWSIKINTLAELTVFADKYGSIVFDSGNIEIYDDYRE